jgi:hypothetical protein
MTRLSVAVALALAAVRLSAGRPAELQARPPDEPLSLWYRQPATQWVEAIDS